MSTCSDKPTRRLIRRRDILAGGFALAAHSALAQSITPQIGGGIGGFDGALGRAGAGIVPAIPGFRQISGLVQFPDKQYVNTNSFTDVQVKKSFFMFKSGVTQVRVQFTNSLVPVTGELTLPTATCKFSLLDPATTTFYPLLFNGASTVVLAPGQIVTSDAVTIPSTTGGVRTNGKKWYVIKHPSWATAPANFPGNVTVMTGFDGNEWGNALTDKTTSGSIAAAVPAGNGDIMPAISILGNITDGLPVVGILGNSITSDNVTTSSVDYFQGWAQSALNDLGIPYVNIGASSLALWVFLSPTYSTIRPRLIQNLVTAGVTHLLCSLSSGDLASLVPRATHLANLFSFKAMLAPYGIKLIPTLPTPRTDITNTTEREGGSWALRADYITDIIANNGVGYGYFDEASGLCNTGNTNLWRTDIRTVSSVAVSAGGSGYATNALLYCSDGIRLRVSAVTTGAVTAATVRSVGGFLVDPVSPIAVQDSLANVTAGGASGTGATFTLTTAAAGLDTVDGIHPGPTYHAYQQVRAVAAFPTLFV